MEFDTAELLVVAPEIFLFLAACVVLVADLFVSGKGRFLTYILTLASLAGTAILVSGSLVDQAQILFHGAVIRDPMGDLLKLFILLVTFAVFLYSKPYQQERGLYRGEYFVLGLFGVLGMMVLVSAYSLLTIYLGVELMSLAMYAMVALQRDSGRASEAAMKYFVLGALASGMLLYGMSMLYGMSGSLNIETIADVVRQSGSNDLVLVFGLVFVMAGLAFKLGAVPFHMWVPDVYQGAPTSVTLYISSAPKIAAFAMVMRLLVDGMGGLVVDWQQMLIILSILSIAIGNVVAIAQTNLKRMLAYSGISHIGFLLLGILSGREAGFEAAMFYTLVYALTSAGGFGMILLMSQKGFEAEELSDYKGLGKKSPWFAFMMLILMFSMAGVPPTVGFYAKFAVLQEVVAVGMEWLAVVAVVFSVIGAFYYLRVIKMIYFDEVEDDRSVPVLRAEPVGITLSINALIVLMLGLFPGVLISLCQSAIG